jgi:valyl-tRNA synthetase
MDDPVKCEKCGSGSLKQDEDVLDTWFSSALWPFSTMGWPDNTDELKKYYPTSVLVTGFDIIFFWVARMIMSGMKFMDDIPFKDVYIHALVRDEHGHKMSKSRGNVIDPLIMMDKYGTDAFRFTLAAFAAQGRDIILSEKRIEGYRSFCNKIWNATRFILMNLGDDFKPGEIEADKLEKFDKWILHKLNETISTVDSALEGYRFNEAANVLYGFWWNEFCDWYLELVKQRIYAKDPAMKGSSDTAKQVLYHVLKKGLQMLHPVMPFITEEIWEKIKVQGEPDIIVSQWPRVNGNFNFAAESDYTELFKELIYRIRNIRGEMNVAPDKKADVVFKTSSKAVSEIAESEAVHIKALARVEGITVDADYIPEKTDASAVLHDAEIFMPLKGLIDIEKEKGRLEKEIVKVTSELKKVEAKLSSENFVSKAPEEVIQKEKGKLEEYTDILSKLQESLLKLN